MKIRHHITDVLLGFGFATMMACGGSNRGTNDLDGAVSRADASELTYMKQFAGKQVWSDTVLESRPFHGRLKALLGSVHPNVLRDMSDLGPPVAADDRSVTISGCRQHDCAATGGFLYIDLLLDNILVGHRVDNKVSVYTEDPMGNGYPKAFTEWAGADPIAEGSTTGGTPDAEATGSFAWVAWTDVSEGVRSKLKRTRWGPGETEFASIQAAIASGCTVQVAEHDLDGDGKPGLIVAKGGCTDHCGSAGCNLMAFDGGRKLSVNDEIEEVHPGKNGVVTSVGVLIPLE